MQSLHFIRSKAVGCTVYLLLYPMSVSRNFHVKLKLAFKETKIPSGINRKFFSFALPLHGLGLPGGTALGYFSPSL